MTNYLVEIILSIFTLFPVGVAASWAAWKFWPPSAEAKYVAAMFSARADWRQSGEHIASHRSGLDVWICSGASGISVHPEGWGRGNRGMWKVTAFGSPNQRAVWRAYRGWRKWYRKQPTNPMLGFRVWLWNGVHLTSPYMKTVWTEPELRCREWDEDDVIRGKAGIHAELLAPSWTWQKPYFEKDHAKQIVIRGVVERFGRYVLGTEGWRAEWVIIRKLLAPTQEIGLALERTYPDVEVIYADR